MSQKIVSSEITAEEIYNKKAKGSSSSAIRLQKQSKLKLDSLITRLNKNRAGRKIKANDLIGYCLDFFNEEHLQILVSRLKTNKERIEAL